MSENKKLKMRCEMFIIALETYYDDEELDTIKNLAILSKTRDALLKEMIFLKVHVIQHDEHLFFNAEDELSHEIGMLNTVTTSKSCENILGDNNE